MKKKKLRNAVPKSFRLNFFGIVYTPLLAGVDFNCPFHRINHNYNGFAFIHFINCFKVHTYVFI